MRRALPVGLLLLAAAPRETRRVIERWLAAVRDADFERGASYFAIPSRVQNGGAPQTLDNPAVAIAWNASLPCGSGVGAPASSRIRVEDGRIVEWVRLPDVPAGSTVEV